MYVRKRIEELIALYSLEPDVKDVYVEGPNDKSLIDWFLSAHDIKDICVYSIDIIEVKEDVLTHYGLDAGSNRSKIVALSAELASSLPISCKIVCIADRDYEDYLPLGIDNYFLDFTDYNSTELYLLRPSMLRKLIYLVLGGSPLSVDDIMNQAVPLLEDLYLMRLANQALKWGMKWVNITKYVHVTSRISFDSDAFKKAYLLKNKKWSQRSKFDTKVEELRSELKEDPRFRVRGHDLMELLYYVVKKIRKGRKFGDVWTFQGAFTGCLELDELSEEGLFRHLLAL